MRLGAVALLVVLCTYSVCGISFHITPDERKCIREEVHRDVLVVGEYKLSEVPDQRTDLLVSDDTRWFMHIKLISFNMAEKKFYYLHVLCSVILIGAHFHVRAHYNYSIVHYSIHAC